MTDAAPSPLVLAVNGGSSSIKFALFNVAPPSDEIRRGSVTGIGTSNATLILDSEGGQQRLHLAGPSATPGGAVDRIVAALRPDVDPPPLAAIVHRLVHGGEQFHRSQPITAAVIAGLRSLVPFAPNHLPGEIALIDAFMTAIPGVPQIACFDTAFHHDLPAISRTLPVAPLPGLRRYGFHGLSYAFLMSRLNEIGGDEAHGRVVLAHLGNGASLAAVHDGRCVDTSMGLTPAGGLVMGTRTGDLDPGVVTFLARSGNLPVEEIDRQLTGESGLRGISGRSADMRELLAHEASDPRARLAVDIFCYQVRKWIGAFAAALGGLDTLVFSGGIGEAAPVVRSRICSELSFLGVRLEEALNAVGAPMISAPAARVRVRVVPTNEALMMAREARQVLAESNLAT
ncbi:MAG: acetate/propionate family kinase [Acidobacteriota bacterium]